MVQKKGKRALLTALSLLVVLLAVVGTIAAIKAMNPGKDDPYVQQTTNETTDETDSTPTDTPSATPTPDDSTSTSDPAIDPATVSTIDVVQMSLTVPYVKGVGGFEYEVLRRPNGTRYVEFSSPELVGTKCTNDKGIFASVLESPTAGETATLAKTTAVDGTTYGLSLAAATCTSNETLLKNYQTAFSTPFSLLKKMN